jgi:holo-[acyl-carrier protein] synthase
LAVIGLGVDLVDVEDAERLLERWGDRLLRRLLTDAERAYVLRFDRPGQYLAVRLAAKEAVYKALQGLPGAREVRWRHIEVVRRHDGVPSIRLHDEAARLSAATGTVRISLSLSHTKRTAGAVALIERD